MQIYTDGTALCTFMQYLLTFCSLPEVASDIVSGMTAERMGLDVYVKFGQTVHEIFSLLTSLRQQIRRPVAIGRWRFS